MEIPSEACRDCDPLPAGCNYEIVRSSAALRPSVFVAYVLMAHVSTLNFSDAGTFSKALSRSNVVCMQTMSGQLGLELTIIVTEGFELHLTKLPVGGCLAVGDAAEDSVSFHVPLSHARTLNLVGAAAEPDVFAAYPRGGELTVRATSGARLAYIVPNKESFPELCRIVCDDERPASTGQIQQVSRDAQELQRLKILLDDIAQAVARSPAHFSSPATSRNLEQTLLLQLLTVMTAQSDARPSFARSQRTSAQIVRKVTDYLQLHAREPVYVLDLCRNLDISQPTLFRAFRQSLGIAPKEYLQLRRLNLARARLFDDPDPYLTVQSVAFDLGFWHLGRFGIAYRSLFNETPSQTLRRCRGGKPPN